MFKFAKLPDNSTNPRLLSIPRLFGPQEYVSKNTHPFKLYFTR